VARRMESGAESAFKRGQTSPVRPSRPASALLNPIIDFAISLIAAPFFISCPDRSLKIRRRAAQSSPSPCQIHSWPFIVVPQPRGCADHPKLGPASPAGLFL
jgi:hypothetical protein